MVRHLRPADADEVDFIDVTTPPPMPLSTGAILPEWLRAIIQDEGRLTLTDAETGRLIGLSRGSVRAAIADDRIQAVRLGRRLLVPVIPLFEMLGIEHGLGDNRGPHA